MDSNHRLDVVVGCPLVLSQLPKAPCLVLDADPQSFERLRSTTAGEEHPWPLTFQQCVLAEDDGNDVVWNIFNDERFNGPNHIDVLKKYGINLAQISSQIHQGRSLASVLAMCSSLQEPSATFRLHLHQGDLVASLKGSGLWLYRCSQITLRAQRFFASDQAQCEDYLLENDFSRSDDDPSVWKPAVGESLSSHGSLLNQKLAVLFNPDAYRRLRPELQHFSDSDLYQNWFNAPNSGELAAAMNRKSNDLISKAQLRALPDDDPIMMFLNDLFPYDYYRSLRSDLQHLENRELLFHYWDFGRFEGVSLSEQGLHNHLQASVDAKFKVLLARIQELEGLLASVRAHQNHTLFQLINDQELADRHQ